MLKINLGGTCGNSKWRNELIEKLNKKIEYRNPVVKNGTWKYNKTIKLKKENDIIIKNNGGLILENLDQIAEFLNNKC